MMSDLDPASAEGQPAAASGPTITTPAALDRASRLRQLTLKQFRDCIPASCSEIDPRRAWGAVASSLLVLGAAELLLVALPFGAHAPLWVWPVYLLLAFVASCAFTGLFVIGHDCGHMAFARSPHVNVLVGQLLMSPMMTPFHNWRLAHNHHHAHTQKRRMDTDWPEQILTRDEYRTATLKQRLMTRVGLGTPVGVSTGFWYSNLRRMLMWIEFPQVRLTRAQSFQLVGSNLLTIAASGVVITLLVRTGGWTAAAKYYGIPATMSMITGGLLTMLHHLGPDNLVFDEDTWTPLRGQVLSTFNVRFPAPLEFFWHDINWHLAHHLRTNIPWYHLREATEAIRRAYPEFVQERRFHVRDLMAIWTHPVVAPTADGLLEAARLGD